MKGFNACGQFLIIYSENPNHSQFSFSKCNHHYEQNNFALMDEIREKLPKSKHKVLALLNYFRQFHPLDVSFFVLSNDRYMTVFSDYFEVQNANEVAETFFTENDNIALACYSEQKVLHLALYQNSKEIDICEIDLSQFKRKPDATMQLLTEKLNSTANLNKDELCVHFAEYTVQALSLLQSSQKALLSYLKKNAVLIPQYWGVPDGDDYESLTDEDNGGEENIEKF